MLTHARGRAAWFVLSLVLMAWSHHARAELPDFRNLSCRESPVTLDQLNQVDQPGNFTPSEFTTWLPSTLGRLTGVAIVFHGANLKPSKMGKIVEFLQNEGNDVLRVSLPGYRGSLDEQKGVTLDLWYQHIFYTYCLARARADQHHVPLTWTGFSLGGLLFQALAHAPMKEEMRWERAILFTPAVALTAKTHWVKVFRVFGKSYVVGSWSHPEYRANDGTTVAAYDALFEAQEKLVEAKFARSNRPTLVLIDPDDVLVDYSGLQEQIKEFGLTQWKLMTVSTDKGELSKTYHHLIIDDRALGKEQWAQVTSAMKELLRSISGTRTAGPQLNELRR